jgi:hypothetical protein
VHFLISVKDFLTCFARALRNLVLKKDMAFCLMRIMLWFYKEDYANGGIPGNSL